LFSFLFSSFKGGLKSEGVAAEAEEAMAARALALKAAQEQEHQAAAAAAEEAAAKRHVASEALFQQRKEEQLPPKDEGNLAASATLKASPPTEATTTTTTTSGSWCRGGFRGVHDCQGWGSEAAERNHGCSDVVPGDHPGWCDCVTRHWAHVMLEFGCGHEPFTCNDVCSRFHAQSDTRTDALTPTQRIPRMIFQSWKTRQVPKETSNAKGDEQSPADLA
jgi:hypothetical protein